MSCCASGKSYTVQEKDTLFLIAQQHLGDGNRWREIRKTDGTNVTDADAPNLKPGQELCIPDGSSVPSSGKGFTGIVPSATFEAMFPNRNGFYSYNSLVMATEKYPNFCNEGTGEQCKREAAAFLANIAHETGNLQHIEELNTANWSHYCDPRVYPCVPGKTYHGRGPIQLSWNYNYVACGTDLGIDLLNNPDLVAMDSSISFMTALWFWMTPQPPKLSCHDAIRTSGFGMTIHIINGGIECGKGQITPQAQNRIQLYQQFASRLGVSPGDNLSC